MTRTDSALLTDLYQLTMIQGYLDHGMEGQAVFEFFVRHLPPHRSFLVAAGLESVLQFLETVCFTTEEVEWLARTGRFNHHFIDYIAGFRFTGDVEAMPEGSVFFADEPILRVMAPLPQAQLVETRVINLLHYQTLVASKAARTVLVAPDKLLVDFGLRRAHGAEAGLYAARASYLVGFAGTSNVLAERAFGIPSYGTMAHSFIQAHVDELTAFENFAHAQPNNVVLLIDTYDTEAAAEKVVALAPRLQQEGIGISAVRIDSGDLAQHAKAVRGILDAGGLADTHIFASGNLDEYEIQRLLNVGAPIDGFGVGTRMLTSADAPYLDCAYKIEEYEGQPRRKRSEGKTTWPGRKQVYRYLDGDGRAERDVLTLEGDLCEGTPLIRPIMQHGQRLFPSSSLGESRAHAEAEIGRLPAHLKTLECTSPYPVSIAPALQALARAMDKDRH